MEILKKDEEYDMNRICQIKHEEIDEKFENHESRIRTLEDFKNSTEKLVVGIGKDLEFTKETTKDIKKTLESVQNTVTNETVKKRAESWEKAIWIIIGAIIMFALRKMGV